MLLCYLRMGKTMSKARAKLEPGLYYINKGKVIVYEEIAEEELLEVVKATRELIKRYGGKGWI